MKNVRKSVELSEKQWAALQELAEATGSVAARGQGAGEPSWRVLLRRIAGSPDILEAIRYSLTSRQSVTTKRHRLPNVVIVRPEKVMTETIAWLSLSGRTIAVHFPEKREKFRRIMKEFGFEWNRPYWKRTVDKRAGDPLHRAAELAHHLLANGFCVAPPSVEVRDMALTASYEPESRRWVQVRQAGTYEGWFALWWSYHDNNFYQAASRITASHWDKPYVVVPPEHWAEVMDFAQIHGFAFDEEAAELAREAKALYESALLVQPPPLPERTEAAGIPDLEVPEQVEIDDALKDDAI